MGIWNDTFESFLDAKYGKHGQKVTGNSELAQDLQSDEAAPTSKIVCVFMQFEETVPTQEAKDIKDPAYVKDKLADNERRIQLIERQYEALVDHFGQEAVEAAKQALRQRRQQTEESDDSESLTN